MDTNAVPGVSFPLVSHTADPVTPQGAPYIFEPSGRGKAPMSSAIVGDARMKGKLSQ